MKEYSRGSGEGKGAEVAIASSAPPVVSRFELLAAAGFRLHRTRRVGHDAQTLLEHLHQRPVVFEFADADIRHDSSLFD